MGMATVTAALSITAAARATGIHRGIMVTGRIAAASTPAATAMVPVTGMATDPIIGDFEPSFNEARSL